MGLKPDQGMIVRRLRAGGWLADFKYYYLRRIFEVSIVRRINMNNEKTCNECGDNRLLIYNEAVRNGTDVEYRSRRALFTMRERS